MKVLITGGCGFVGSHLSEKFLSEGFDVRILGLSCDFDNVKNLMDSNKVELIHGDIADPQVCKKAVEGCDIVSHLAALISVDQSIAEPQKFFSTNVGGTFNLLDAARNANVKKFHHMSTCEVIGNIDHPHKAAENWPQSQPRSPYASSKLAAESYCMSYYHTYDLPIVITRSFNIFGPRQNPGTRGAVISRFAKFAIEGKPLQIYGDGMQTRDWTFVEDIRDGIFKCITKEGVEGELFHLASGEDHTVNEVANLVIKLSGSNVPLGPEHIDARPGELRRSIGDYSKSNRAFGWSPTVSFKDGVQKVLDYFNSN